MRSVVLDLDRLTYLSSAGLRILIAIQKRMEATGGEDICVCNASGAVLKTLEMVGLQGVIRLE